MAACSCEGAGLRVSISADRCGGSAGFETSATTSRTCFPFNLARHGWLGGHLRTVTTPANKRSSGQRANYRKGIPSSRCVSWVLLDLLIGLRGEDLSREQPTKPTFLVDNSHNQQYIFFLLKFLFSPDSSAASRPDDYSSRWPKNSKIPVNPAKCSKQRRSPFLHSSLKA